MKMPDITTPINTADGHQVSARELVTNTTLSFQDGLPGFSALRRAAISFPPMIEPFFHLRAQNIVDLVFVCVEPFLVYPEYSVTIPDSFARSLGLKSSRDAWLISLVTLAPCCEDITANLMCPIVVNVQTCQAKQLIIEDAEEMLRFRIWDQVQVKEQKVS